MPKEVYPKEDLKVIRLSDLKSRKGSIEKTEENTTDIPAHTQVQVFSPELFQKEWEAFIEHLKSGKNERPLALLLEQLRPVIENSQVLIEFTTKAQKSMFDEHLIDLNTRLNRAFGERIVIERRINASIELKQQVAITAEDQFKEMAEKNPLLLEMKKKFGLDFS